MHGRMCNCGECGEAKSLCRPFPWKSLLYLIGVGLVGLCITGPAWFVFNQPKTPRVSEAKQYVQERCGILGSDLLHTTAMEKIEKCLKEADNGH
jgi:hypothetical protein